MNKQVTIDTADTVLHKPTGETWTVALVDGDRLSWVGWPEGWAMLCDCELREKATAEERQRLLREMALIRENDHRKRYAKYVLSQEGQL